MCSHLRIFPQFFGDLAHPLHVEVCVVISFLFADFLSGLCSRRQRHPSNVLWQSDQPPQGEQYPPIAAPLRLQSQVWDFDMIQINLDTSHAGSLQRYTDFLVTRIAVCTFSFINISLMTVTSSRQTISMFLWTSGSRALHLAKLSPTVLSYNGVHWEPSHPTLGVPTFI